MTKAGGEQKVRACLSGVSFSAVNQNPGGYLFVIVVAEGCGLANPEAEGYGHNGDAEVYVV